LRSLVAAAFLLLAGWFVTVSGSGVAPSAPGGVVPFGEGSRSLARTVLGDPPTSRIGGLVLDCDHCHALFARRDEPPEVLVQHRYLAFDHGVVERCDRCHSREVIDRLVLPSGEELDYAEVDRLCESCHGLVYRDWERSLHGKTTGSWRVDSPERGKVRCTECHGPHRPAFGALPPLPGPSTLRMRATSPVEAETGEEPANPLLLPPLKKKERDR